MSTARRSRPGHADLWRGREADRRARRDQPADRRRRVRRLRRPERLRQVVAAQAGVGPGSANSGNVIVAQQEVNAPIKIVGMAFQNPNLLPWRTTLRNVMLPVEIVEPHRSRWRRRARRLCGAGARRCCGRSGWPISRTRCLATVRRHAAARLALPRADARAVAAAARRAVRRARCLHPRGIMGRAAGLWMERRFTVMLVTHDLREALYLSDTIYVMSARPGRILVRHHGRFPAAADARQHLRAGIRRSARRIARPHLRSTRGDGHPGVTACRASRSRRASGRGMASVRAAQETSRPARASRVRRTAC